MHSITASGGCAPPLSMSHTAFTPAPIFHMRQSSRPFLDAPPDMAVVEEATDDMSSASPTNCNWTSFRGRTDAGDDIATTRRVLARTGAPKRTGLMDRWG